MSSFQQYEHVLFQVWDDMSCCTEEDVERLLPLVSHQRREQALRFRYLFGRWACLKTYEMLCGLLVQMTGSVQLPEFTYNEHGKPFLKDGHYFSISHCRKALLVGVSIQPVGVDIESVRIPNQALIERVMNPQECRHIYDSPNHGAEFTRLWTAKEAVLKLRGTGIIDSMQDVLQGTEPCRTYCEKDYVYTIAVER